MFSPSDGGHPVPHARRGKPESGRTLRPIRQPAKPFAAPAIRRDGEPIHRPGRALPVQRPRRAAPVVPSSRDKSHGALSCRGQWARQVRLVVPISNDEWGGAGDLSCLLPVTSAGGYGDRIGGTPPESGRARVAHPQSGAKPAVPVDPRPGHPAVSARRPQPEPPGRPAARPPRRPGTARRPVGPRPGTPPSQYGPRPGTPPSQYGAASPPG